MIILRRVRRTRGDILEPVKTALVGISGIGGYHRGVLHDLPEIELVAAADRWLEREPVSAGAEQLQEWGVPVYGDIWEMLEAHEVTAVTIATPHSYHAPYALGCLERGLHVCVEKPLSVMAADGVQVAEEAARRGLFVAVDFQYAGFPHSIKLKELICNGELGELREIVGVMEWMRTEEYYQRSDWSGKRYYDGLPCWDGVLMNQAVHLLNSALHMGTREQERAIPLRVQAELCRGHDIETEDVAALRADLGEATLHFYATTCCEADLRTTLEIIGTRGRASWSSEKAVVWREGKDELVFEEPCDRNAIHQNLVQCIWGQEKKLLASASESVKATMAINGAYASAGRIPKVSWEEMGDIRSLIDAAAEKRSLLSEMPGVSWISAGEVVELEEFMRFSGLEDDAEVCGC